MRSVLRSTPLQLFLCIIFSIFFGEYLPLSAIRFFYSISLFFVDSALFILPIIIFSYIFLALVAVEKNAPLVVGILIGVIFVSNFLAITYAYGMAYVIVPCLKLSIPVLENNDSLIPLFKFPIKHNLRSDLVALFAFLCAWVCAKCKSKFAIVKVFESNMSKLQCLIDLFLKKAFIPLLPLYLLGFILKMVVDGSIAILYNQYLSIFIANIGMAFIYITIIYIFASKLTGRKFKNVIVNMIPAGITGFSTMSGIVTMPVTISCADKNVDDPRLNKLVISTSSNMHMLGDDISITITAIALLLLNGHSFPSFIDFFPFIIGFCVAKIACVGVAGASLLVVLPVLKEKLGFSYEMISMITTIYILHDSFGTFHNVMGNGAFAMILDKIFKKIKIR